MVETTYFGYITISLWDALSAVLLVSLILFFSYIAQKSQIAEKPYYKYYTIGLIAKIIGCIVFVLTYIYYYGSGDTFAYYESALAMRNLLTSDYSGWLANEFGNPSYQVFKYFTPSTGYPLAYIYFDPQTFTVIRLINPLFIFTFNSYLLTSILICWLAYSGAWKLYEVFAQHYPERQGGLAIGMLMFPSILFWGSGILKDTITLSCSGWVVYCIYQIFILRRRILQYIPVLIFTTFLVLLIKPYILFALLPGTIVWIFYERISKIQNGALQAMVVPLIFMASILFGYVLLSSLSAYMGKFSLNNISTTLTVTASDLKQDYYQGHSFDIGNVNNSTTGYIQKIPAATTAGLYRPFIWETNNFVTLLSGIENMVLLYFTLLAFRRSGILHVFKRILREPLLFFTFSYALFFAFAVGLSTSNFGALVRFKIAYLPFFTALLFILTQKETIVEEEDEELLEEVPAITS